MCVEHLELGNCVEDSKAVIKHYCARLFGALKVSGGDNKCVHRAI